MRWLVVGPLVLLVLVGCDVAAEPPPEPPPRPPILDHLPKVHDRIIDVFVDRDHVAAIEVDQLRQAVRIDHLTDHPIGTWASIEVRGDGVGPTTWLDPGKKFKGAVPLVYLNGTDAAVGLFDPAKIAARDAVVSESRIDEIRIALAKPAKTGLDKLAAGCMETESELPPPIPEKWRGTTHQFNLDVYWRTQLSVKLGPGPVGGQVGTMTQQDTVSGKVCVYDLYRQPDRNNRRSVHAVLRPGPACVDDLLEFACNGNKLEVFSYYTYGDYIEHGLLTADPPAKK